MRLSSLVVATLAAGCAASAQPRADVASFVVSTEWLAAHRNDRNLVLVHIVQDSSYRKEQIPGSRQLWYRRIVTTNGTVGSELPTVDSLRTLLERMGINNRSHVVVYAPDAPMATRFLFTLDYLGHTRMSFLDGGLRKWTREGRPVTTDVVQPVATKYEPAPREELVATAEWISERIGAPGLSLIDTRTSREYLGTPVTGGMPSAGHLAGAQQLEWEWMFADDEHSTLRSRDELKKLYDARVRPGDKVVTYCWVGYRGSATYFIARYLGYDVKLYDGSYQDWSQRSLQTRAGSSP